MKLGIVSSLVVVLFASQQISALLATENIDEWSVLTNNDKNDGGGSFRPDLPLSQTHEQRTVICPGPAQQNLYEGHVRIGHRTRLVIKNTASESVVIAFVERNGIEYSAANEGIRPAASDPDAALAPGMAKVFAVNEGHVFHVRNLKTGELMAQHRVGLMPVENRYNHNIDACPGVHEEEEPVDDGNFRVMRKFLHWKPALIQQYGEEVIVDVGIKNTIKSRDGKTCPVNLYFITKEERGGRRKPNYVERFIFQLGDNTRASSFDGELWDASTKYERTYLGHEFIARLAHDESIVVDHMVVGPFKVQDCGRRKQRDAVKSAAHASAIVIPVRGKNSEHAGVDNETESSLMVDAFAHYFNTTESRRGIYFKIHSD
jgi:hypothetical protein